MSSEVQIQLKKKDFNSATDSTNGCIVFDNTTNKIYVGGVSFSSDVKNITYDSTNKILTITKNDSTTISLNFSDTTSANQPNSLLASLRDDIDVNTSSISTLNGIGSGSIDSMIDTKIGDLTSDITIASVANDIVTIKADIDETNGVISNSTSSNITLAKVASTGSATDVSVTYNNETSNVQTTITDIDSRLDSLSSNQLQYIIPTSNNTTPSGYYHYYSGSSYYEGNLTASSSTTNKIYLCRTTQDGDYHQIMTVVNSTGTTYSWVDLSTESIDLSGYVKSITINGQTYTTTSTGTDITLADVITAITGENNITTGNSDYVSVVATTSTASAGSKTTTLSSKLKTQDVSTATSTSDGVALSYNVKEYVDANLTTIRTWTDNDIVNS